MTDGIITTQTLMPPMTSPRSDAPRLSSKSRAMGSASFQPDAADGSWLGSLTRRTHTIVPIVARNRASA